MDAEGPPLLSVAEAEEPPISTSGTEEKPLRADARRNRERLVETARAAFTEQGEEATLEGIARVAGVGIGTLYRHFPTREALIEAVYRAEIARLRDSAPGLLEGRSADRALRAWMDRFIDYFAVKREMADVLHVVVSSGAVSIPQVRAEMAVAVQVLLDAGVADGTLRGDVAAPDVVAGIIGAYLGCGPDQREQIGRLFDLLADGLRRN